MKLISNQKPIIKAGKDTLNIKTVGKIAKALDVPVDEILIID